MEPGMDLLRQIRKALRDIDTSFDAGHHERARYQLSCLRLMIDLSPDRRQPWSHYQPAVDEEFGS